MFLFFYLSYSFERFTVVSTLLGEGMTHASLRFPEVALAIQNIAFTRPHSFSEEPYPAHLNAAKSSPVHKESHERDVAHFIWQLLKVEDCGWSHR